MYHISVSEVLKTSEVRPSEVLNVRDAHEINKIRFNFFLELLGQNCPTTGHFRPFGVGFLYFGRF